MLKTLICSCGHRWSLDTESTHFQTQLEAEPGESGGADAEAINPEDWQRVFDLAYHYDAAGQSVEAMVYALAAAEQARRQHSLEIAEQQYEIARRGFGDADRQVQYRILEGLGDVLMLRGRYLSWRSFSARTGPGLPKN